MNSKTVTAELKPCPFCGSGKLFSHREPTRIYEGMGPAWIRCDGCHCQLTMPEFDKLVVAWNARAADPQRAKLVEALLRIAFDDSVSSVQSNPNNEPSWLAYVALGGITKEGLRQTSRKEVEALASLGEKK